MHVQIISKNRQKQDKAWVIREGKDLYPAIQENEQCKQRESLKPSCSSTASLLRSLSIIIYKRIFVITAYYCLVLSLTKLLDSIA